MSSSFMASSSFSMDRTYLSKDFPSTEALLAASSAGSREKAKRESVSAVCKDLHDVGTRNSRLDNEKLKEIPRFDGNELNEGLVLGTGGFASVYEVRGFHILDQGTHIKAKNKPGEKSAEFMDEEVDPGEVESRKFIAKHCYRHNGDPRYAIKRLRQATMDDALSFLNGMSDIATETMFLASLQHPNIIKLRGVSSGNMFSEDYFLILDRLYDTLAVRILKWRNRKKNCVGIMGTFKDRDGGEKKKLKIERLAATLDLAAALAYIHRKGIIHRDLKTENIGFDVRDDIKIFDFGLAKELPEHADFDSAFQLTAMCGTPRYMAPEVALGFMYNEKCDIYSLGLLFWEIMTLKRPYQDQKSFEAFQKNVWSGEEVRPSVPKKMPAELDDLMTRSWSPEFRNRPSADQFENALRVECLLLQKDMRVSHTNRRSTFILVKGKGETINKSARTVASLSQTFFNDNDVDEY